MSTGAATAFQTYGMEGLGWKELLQSLAAITKFSSFGENPATIKVQSRGDRWIEPCVGRLSEILSLSQDWDSYGARAIKLNSVLGALRFLAMTMKPNTPIPDIGPSRNGNVVLEWHTLKGDLEVEILADANCPSRVEAEYSVFFSKGLDDPEPREFIMRDPNEILSALTDLTA